MRSKSQYTKTILLTAGILILLNILSAKYFLRLDLTEDKRYTLSDATKDILGELTEPVTIKAYFSNNLPPMLDNLRRDFRNLLTEYTQNSHGMVVFEFIDPLKEEGGEAKAQQAGVMQMQVQVREKDQMQAQIAYMGASIEMGERKEVLPVIQSTSGMEYFLTSSIKKLAVVDKPLVGLLRGHGESGLSDLQQASRDLSVLYQLQEVRLSDTINALDPFQSVIILGPKDSIPQNQLDQLTGFLARGGNLLVAINRTDASLQSKNPMAQPLNTGLETWLSKLGVNVNENMVIDASAVTVMATRQQGPFRVQQPILFPYIPEVKNFGKHPVTGGLEQVIMNFVSSIDFTGDSTIKYTPLLLSSENSGTLPARTYIDPGRKWQDRDFPMKSLVMGAALEGNLAGADSRMVVIADADFPLANGQQQVNPDNVNLFVNAVDWLSDDTGLIELRTQGATARPLDDMDDSKKSFLKYLNFLLPILLTAGYGVFRAQKNRILRIKRMEVGYV